MIYVDWTVFYFHKIFIIWPEDFTLAVSVAASHPPTVQLPASLLPSDQLARLLEIDWNLSNITDRSLIKYLMFSCSIYTPNTSFTKITIRCFKRFKIFWWTQWSIKIFPVFLLLLASTSFAFVVWQKLSIFVDF